MAKSDAGNAERAAEWYAHEVLDCVKTVRAVRTRFQRQDLFACDCIGKRADGTMVWIQVTAGKSANVAQRRRKIEAIPWGVFDDVRLLEFRKGLTHWFRVHRYVDKEWVVDEGCTVPRSWFKAYRPKGEA